MIDIEGASPAKTGAQMILLDDGTTAGTVGGGKPEAAIKADVQTAFADGQSRLTHYTLTEAGEDAVGTLCGGEVCVFIQPFLPQPQLVIVGGGHIGRPLKVMGKAAGFEVTVVDVDPSHADMLSLAEVALTEDSYIVLITTDHVSDETALRQVITSPARYIVVIGSRAKSQTILHHLQEDGYTNEILSRVYAPIGLDLGGTTPQEIAVAILAEVIAVQKRPETTQDDRISHMRL